MGNESSSLGRDLAGFVIGSVLGMAGALLAYMLVNPPPYGSPPEDYSGAGFDGLALVMLIAGGVVGRRGFSADSLSDFIPSFGTSLGIVLFLIVLTGLSVAESLLLLGFVLIGLVVSASGSLMVQRVFPRKLVVHDLDEEWSE